MTHGIKVTNEDGHTLISSDIRSFHYVGEAEFIQTTVSGLTEFQDYDEPNVLDGAHIHVYEIVIPNGADPLVFIQPGNNTEAYGILRKYLQGTGLPFEPPQEGGGGGGGGDPGDPGDPEPPRIIEMSVASQTWTIEVIQRGRTSRPPLRVMCFYQLLGYTVPAEEYGLITRLENGELAFDSGRLPLSVHAVVNNIPPEVPLAGGVPLDITEDDPTYWNDTELDHDFRCGNVENLYDINANVGLEDIAFTAPALAQCVYGYSKYGFKRSRGLLGSQDHQSVAHWWCMYHQAFRLDGVGSSTLKFAVGWSPFFAAFNFDSDWESGGLFGGSGGTVEYGLQPYPDKTINLVNNIAMFIRASDYAGQYIDTGAIM